MRSRVGKDKGMVATLVGEQREDTDILGVKLSVSVQKNIEYRTMMKNKRHS